MEDVPLLALQSRPNLGKPHPIQDLVPPESGHINTKAESVKFLNFSLENKFRTVICTPERFFHSWTLSNALERFSNAF